MVLLAQQLITAVQLSATWWAAAILVVELIVYLHHAVYRASERMRNFF
jgi:hypothetical protein